MGLVMGRDMIIKSGDSVNLLLSRYNWFLLTCGWVDTSTTFYFLVMSRCLEDGGCFLFEPRTLYDSPFDVPDEIPDEEIEDHIYDNIIRTLLLN